MDTADMSAGTAIEVRDLSVSFAGHRVLEGLSHDFPARGITVIIGPSGSGKTTLLRAVNRLNECFAGCRTSGTVRLALTGGMRDVYAPDCRLPELRRRVAMVFQTPSVLPGSIHRNLAVPLQAVMRVPKTEIPERIATALAQVGLYEEVRGRLNEPAHTLSGGQQQLLCLARALALTPSVLLLDEPTSSLDFLATREIEALLLRLVARYTIVAVSHSLEQTQRLANQVVLLDGGQRLYRLEPDAIASVERLERRVEGLLRAR
jgi:phosphate transport system ATP-binding protein